MRRGASPSGVALSRGAAARAAAAAAILAAGLASAALAQTGPRIETSEPIGDWEKVTVSNSALYVTATPALRAARAYCLSSYLKIPYDAIPNFGASAEAGAEAERIGASRGYACLQLACVGAGAKREIAVNLVANAPPEPGETGMPHGVSLRMRFAANETPVPLFERAGAGQRSRDGAYAMIDWSVSPRREGAEGAHAQVAIAFTAPLAFVEQLAAKPRVTFELRPGQDRQADVLKHGARQMEFALAGTATVLAELRQACARGN
jgi:hypothetical protein